MTDWPQDEAETAARMWGDGFSAAFIAERLGLTRNAVIGKMGRMKARRAPNVACTGRTRASRPRPRPQPQAPLWVKLVELDFGMCRYPRGERPNVEYCGAAVEAGSWCAAHRRIVFTSLADAALGPTVEKG